MSHASGLLVAALGAALLGACAPRPTLDRSSGWPTPLASPAPRTVRLNQADDGHTSHLQVGDTLEVTLPGNPSTGSAWLLSEPPSPVLIPLGEATVRAASGGLGANGQVVLQYRVAAAGIRRLSLAYRRPFGPPNPNDQTFMVTVLAR